MKRMLGNPATWLGATYGVCSLGHFLALSHGVPVSLLAGRLEAFALGFIAACWIARDAKGKVVWLPDLSLIFYPLLFPVYLIATRKWKGVVWLILIWVGYAMTYLLPQWLAGEAGE